MSGTPGRTMETGGSSRPGDLVAVNDRLLPYCSALFPIILKGDHPEENIRLQGGTGLGPQPSTLARPEAFQVPVGTRPLVIGVVLGLLIMVIAINAINWILDRARLTSASLASWQSSAGWFQTGFSTCPRQCAGLPRGGSPLPFHGCTIMLIRGPCAWPEHFPRFNRILPYVASSLQKLRSASPLATTRR